MKWIWLGSAILLTGCSGGNSVGEEEAAGGAKSVEYSTMDKHVGEKVKTVAWVLGEGESYRVEGKFVLALVPDPDMDWAGFFNDFDEMSSLVTSLESDPDRRAEARDVDKYMKLQDAVNKWHDEIVKVEKAPECVAWGAFKQNVLTARYDWFSDAPSILVSPKRSELKAAADAVFERYEQIAKSCQLEIVGKVRNTGDWAQDNRVNTTLGPQLGQKKFVIEVESYKVLKTAREEAKAGGRGTSGLIDPETDESKR